MFFKIAINNIKKSFKDYTIYFMTLIIAVSMFYVFNSLDSQTIMMNLTESKSMMLQNLIKILGMVSVFVAGVLGYLVLYANSFLIRRRKKEFGLYQTLGMSKGKISIILFIETLVVGFLSLLIGSIVGIILSQGLSVITAKLFQADLEEYKFVFSRMSLTKTLIYFSLIYLFVFIFNTLTISKYKLIDLLTASKKNQKIKVKNVFIKTILFIVSIGLIGYAYKLLLVDHVTQYFDTKFLLMLVLGAFGTYLLFVSIASFALKVVQSNKKLYYKNLNTFVLRQLNNKINTTTISITVISLMILLTVVILSASTSLVTAFNKDLSSSNLIDISLIKMKEPLDTSAEEDLKKANLTNYFDKYVNYDEYYLVNMDASKFFTEEIMNKIKTDFAKLFGGKEAVNFEFSNIPVIKESSYNKMMELNNTPKNKISLAENEYAFVADFEKLIPYYNEALEASGIIKIGNKEYISKNKTCIMSPLMNSNMPSNTGIIVLKDNIVDSEEKVSNRNILCGNYINDGRKKQDIELEFMNKAYEFKQSATENNTLIYKYLYTKLTMEASSVGLSAMLTFIGMYLGIVFSITSAAILAIGQLSESSDNKERYAILRRIGVDDNMINRALFTQIAIYFGLPLVVAIVHSVVAMKEVNTLVSIFGNINIADTMAFAGIFITVVYGIYFIATYFGSKLIIKEKERYID